MKALAPFIDEKCLMRVGGRIKKAHVSYDVKHQILMPKKHPLTISLVNYFHHYRTCHSGSQTIVTAIRQRYWPIGCLQLAKDVIRLCV